MSNKQLAGLIIFCTVCQICAFIACTNSHNFHKHEQPREKLNPYFDNGGKFIRVTDLRIVKGVWYINEKLLVIEKNREKDFLVWIESWQEFVGGKRK